MAVSYRFIRNLEVAIKDREKYSSNLGKVCGGGMVGSFSSKGKIRGILSGLSEYTPEKAVWKGL